MALTKAVTKLWPTRNVDDQTFHPGIHLVLQDDGVTVIEQDFSAPYGGAGQLAEARDRVLVEAQAAINKYKAEKTLNSTTAYTNAVAFIDSGLIL